MSKKTSSTVKLLNRVFLAVFGGLLLIEGILGGLVWYFGAQQTNFLNDQARLFRIREFILGYQAKLEAHTVMTMVEAGQSGSAEPHQPAVAGGALSVSELFLLFPRLNTPDAVFAPKTIEALGIALQKSIERYDEERAALQAAKGFFPNAAGEFVERRNADLLPLKNLAEDTTRLTEWKAIEQSLEGFLAMTDVRLYATAKHARRCATILRSSSYAALALLVLATAGGGIFLYWKVREPVNLLKNQTRKAQDTLARLQSELRAVQMERDQLQLHQRHYPAVQVAPTPATSPDAFEKPEFQAPLAPDDYITRMP